MDSTSLTYWTTMSTVYAPVYVADANASNSSTSVLLSDTERQALIARWTKERILLTVPVLIFICVLMFIGFLGNALVLFTYAKRATKSSTNLFIFTLATFDLVNCSLTLPFVMYHLLRPYTNNHPPLCSIYKFVGVACDLSSGFIIVCISFDRYLRIARPHQGLSVKGSKIAIIITCLASLAVASLTFFVFGIHHVLLDADYHLYGTQCGIRDDAEHTVWPLLFSTLILVCFIVGIAILLTVYTLLGLKVKRWSKGRKTKQIGTGRTSEYLQGTVILDDADWPESPEPQMEKFAFIKSPSPERPRSELNNENLDGQSGDEREPEMSSFKRPVYVRELSRSLDKTQFTKIDQSGPTVSFHNNGMQTLPLRRPKRSVTIARKTSMPSLQELKRKMKVSRTTVMFISATIAFVVSHIPYAVIKTVESIHTNLTESMSDVGYSLFMFAEYSFIVSYAANPVIYSFMNPKYRRECKSLFVEISKTIKCHSHKLYSP